MTTTNSLDRADLRSVAAGIGQDVAGPAAADVDRQARFPRESIEALRDARMLSAYVPTECGGAGASLAEIAGAVEALGQQCASTAMIFAMHQIQVACLVRHGRTGYWRALTGEIADAQLLLGSATTEAGIGGDVRSSSCAVEVAGDTFQLKKNAPVISYGAYSDLILVTARRTPDSPPNDQVLVACRTPGLSLRPTSEWDTLGFRGTCSPGFMLEAGGSVDAIMDDSYGDISSQTMLPVSHILWSSAWLGLATAAVDTARRFVRGQARNRPGVTPPGALRVAELVAVHQQMKELVHGAARRFDEAAGSVDELSGLGFAIAMNSLKVAASSLVVDIVGSAMLICGIAGYREDSEYSLGRHLRDAYGAALMVNNDRILGNSAQLLLVSKD
ncbi:MAG TPA: acyl-CoA dehydrogenase family protein [Acidothermaceae bacterium]